MLVDPVPATEFEQFLFGNVRHGGEVEGVELFEHGEPGGLDAGRDGVGGAGGDLDFGQLQQVLFVRCVAVGGVTSQFLVLRQHRRQFQLFQVGL